MRGLTLYVRLIGAGELLTGVLLLWVPSFTLQLMGIAEVPGELIYMRFVGAFVGGIGALYLYPFLLAPARRLTRLRVVLEATSLVRLWIGFFVASAVLGGALSLPWISVAIFDLTIAIFQLLSPGRFFVSDAAAGSRS